MIRRSIYATGRSIGSGAGPRECSTARTLTRCIAFEAHLYYEIRIKFLNSFILLIDLSPTSIFVENLKNASSLQLNFVRKRPYYKDSALVWLGPKSPLYWKQTVFGTGGPQNEDRPLSPYEIPLRSTNAQ
ncbi:hypothetical protein EVAR_20217_1 [Eumeta japonica]|uniref:Uncharacterized protein n=1 Tax=Eumeta variegata TaxID=151549 RepID=A0A4C1WAP9_EUMVA|nr:hypothetical protein EVAR_20217_1 [Eumeta japonica]